MRVLVVLTRVPDPPTTGDRVRARELLLHLGQNHDVHALCLGRDAAAGANLDFGDRVTIEVVQQSPIRSIQSVVTRSLRGLPGQVGLYSSPALANRIRELCRSGRFNVVLAQLARVMDNLSDTAGVPVVIDYVDALSLGAARRSSAAAGPMKAIFSSEAKRLRSYEVSVGAGAARRIATSPVDAAHLEQLGTGSVDVIPVGVPDRLFELPIDRERDLDVIFTGNLGYAPNVEAGHEIGSVIVPGLAEQLPKVSAALVGARPDRRLQRLASSELAVHGPVDDLLPWLSRSRVALAPMRSGSGIQLKILEAMAAGVPVVASSLANRAVGASPGVHLRIAESSAEFVDAATQLLQDPVARTELALQGRAFVAERYKWSIVNDDFEAVLAAVAR